MRKTVLAFLAILLLCPALVLGQGPTPSPAPPGAVTRGPMPPPELGAWWKNSDIVARLQLSDAQIKQIESTFLEHRLKLIDLHAEVERQEAKLQPLIEADQPDEAKVGAQVELLIAARGKLEKANIMMMLAIRKQLTVEQWKKLQAIQQERERFHGANMFFRVQPPPPPQALPPGADD